MTNISDVEIITKKLSGKNNHSDDDGCQEFIKNELLDYGFIHENIDLEDVKISGLEEDQTNHYLFFAGHTDVVPPGNIDEWETEPFTPEVKNNILWKRCIRYEI